MGKSITKNWIHCVWATKNRAPLILPHFEYRLHKFIMDELIKMGCYVENINRMEGHIHCLFLLTPKKSMIDVVKQIKGSCSRYVNEQNFLNQPFIWQRGFGAFSVSESGKDNVKQYIKNQKHIHRKRTYLSEYRKLVELHNASKCLIGDLTINKL